MSVEELKSLHEIVSHVGELDPEKRWLITVPYKTGMDQVNQLLDYLNRIGIKSIVIVGDDVKFYYLG